MAQTSYSSRAQAQASVKPGQRVYQGVHGAWWIQGTLDPEPEPEPELETWSVFTQQEKTVETLQEILDRQDEPRPQQVYYSTSAPQPEPTNYLLYIGIGIGILIFTGRFKI